MVRLLVRPLPLPLHLTYCPTCFILCYSSAQYLFLQMRNQLFEVSRVFGGCHLWSLLPRLPVRALNTEKHPHDVVKLLVNHC